MQVFRHSFLSCAGLLLLSQAPTADAVSLSVLEEPLTNLVSPVVQTPPMKYAVASGALVATPITATPLICANTWAPAAAGMSLNPVYYSSAAIGATTPLPFVFGALPSSPGVSAQASGSSGMNMKGGLMQFAGDSAGSLVCYGLDASGTHRLTPDIFKDGLNGGEYNSSVTLTVFHLPSGNTDYYGYRVDVTLPPLPSTSDSFALIEGYDSSVFATTAAESPSNTQGNWCQSFDGQSCAFAPNAGNINFSYLNGFNSSLQAPVAPNGTTQYHFIVKRYLRNGQSLPASGAPVAIAALLSPNDLEENKLDDNVAVGNNQLSNVAPAVAQDGAFTTFTGSLAGLTENTDSGTLTFDISDSDTAEAGRPPLSAAVTLTLAGLSVSASADCSTLVPNGGGAPTPVNRVCSVSIPLSNANWWNSSVASTYDGLFNTFATDTTNGFYASGVSANARIVVTDSLGKAAAPVNVPVHVHSNVNNAPVIAYASPFQQQLDPNNSQSYPTYSCSVGLGTAAGGCGAAVRGSILVDLPGSASALGGPPAAFDELASQTTAVVPYSDPSDSFTNVQCTNEQQSAVFAASGGPIVAASGGSGTQYGMNFLLPTTPPASAVSALCTLTVTDVGPFPNGQTAKTAAKQFRVVINP